MEQVITCPGCQRRWTVPEGVRGAVRCPACGASMPVGGVASPPAPSGPAAATPGPVSPPPASQAPSAPAFKASQGAASGAAMLPHQMIANRLIAGRTCSLCSRAIALGEPVRNCELCGQSFHAECWNARGGCGTASCANAPLPQMQGGAGPAPGSARPGAPPPLGGVTGRGAGTKACPYCGEQIAIGATLCRHCNEYLFQGGPRAGVPGGFAAAGPYVAPAMTSGKAVASMVLGILSLVGCGIGLLLGFLAVSFAARSKREIGESRGRLTGSGMATAGLVMGIIGIAGNLLWLILIASR